MLDSANCRINYPALLKELKVIEKDYLPLLPDEIKEQYKSLTIVQNSLRKDDVFKASARLVRFLHKRYETFVGDIVESANTSGITNFNRETIFSKFPLMIPSKNSGKVYVFPHLILDKISKSNLRNICWIVCFDSLQTLNDKRAKNPRNWHPFSRAWKKIKQHEELSVIRALIRYTALDTVYEPHVIGALAEAYEDLSRPLELIYADTPKDYVTMFKSGGVSTCMTTTGDKAEIWTSLLQQGHHPTSLFAYHPRIKGVYCMRSGKVVARTFLYQMSNGRWKYGRRFYINKMYKEKFDTILLASNYTLLNSDFKEQTTIEVPGIYSESHNDYVLPVPYMDNIGGSICSSFDKITKIFTVVFHKLSSHYSNIPTGSTGGLVGAKYMAQIPCFGCGDHCSIRHITWDGRYTFCSITCATDHNYIYARTSNNTSSLLRESTCFVDPFTSEIFSNKQSCVRHGGLRIINNVTVDDYGTLKVKTTDPIHYSVGGTRVEYRKKMYALEVELFNKLRRNKLIISESYTYVIRKPK